MNEDISLEIGTPADMGRRFLDAWHAADNSDVRPGTHITFRDLETLLTALTPLRLHLLRYVRRHDVRSVEALAVGLNRDFAAVQKDVQDLSKIGLLSRTPHRVAAPYANVDARFVL